MKKIDFNRNWLFYQNGKETQKQQVTLPHDAMLREPRDPHIPMGSQEGFFPGGKYVYVKHFSAPENAGDLAHILEFEGSYMNTEVLINGRSAGSRVYGYAEFHVDISPLLKPGEDNEIEVRVDNSVQPNARWYSGSGLYRHVSLLVGPKEHIAVNGVKVTPVSISPAVIRVETAGCEAPGLSVLVEILWEGKTVAKGKGSSLELTLSETKPWTADHPDLYQAKVTLIQAKKVLDEQVETFGLRILAYSPTQGLLLNGKRILLKGGCIHHDNGVLGAADNRYADERKIRILKKMGFNAIRSAHHPMSRTLLNLCDRLGMYVLNEAFDVWTLRKSRYDYGIHFHNHWQEDLETMVLCSYNHPSVLLYSLGNEIQDTAFPHGAARAKELFDHLKSLDASRPVTLALSFTMNLMAKAGFYFQEPKAGQAEQRLDFPADGFALKLVMFLMNLFEKQADGPKGDRLSRETFQALDIAGYNYGTRRYAKDHRKYPERVILGTETYSQDIAKSWKYLMTHNHVIGDFMWTAWDYLGEAGIGVWEYGAVNGSRFKPYPALTAGCGAIDLNGLPGSPAFLASTVWGNETIPYIGVRPVQHANEKAHPAKWRGTDSVDSWSWKGCEGYPAHIEVFSDQSRLELLQDGKSLGTKKLRHHVAHFSTKFFPGELVAIAYDRNGIETGRRSLKSAHGPSLLCLHPEKTVLNADGEDVLYLHISIADDNRVIRLLDDRPVTISVSGAGKLAGFGSANPVNAEDFLGTRSTTYLGRTLAVVQSGWEPGEILVKVASEGLLSQEVRITVR